MSENPDEPTTRIRPLRIALALLTLVAWILFVLIDLAYQREIRPAAEGTYGEMFGPLSFFQPAARWIAVSVTACFCGAELFARGRRRRKAALTKKGP